MEFGTKAFGMKLIRRIRKLRLEFFCIGKNKQGKFGFGNKN